jgi:hypothetical protein
LKKKQEKKKLGVTRLKTRLRPVDFYFFNQNDVVLIKKKRSNPGDPIKIQDLGFEPGQPPSQI